MNRPKSNAGQVLAAAMAVTAAIEQLRWATGAKFLFGLRVEDLTAEAHDLENEALGTAAEEVARLFLEISGGRPSSDPARKFQVIELFDRVKKILELKGWPVDAFDFVIDFVGDDFATDGFSNVFGDNPAPVDVPVPK